MFFYVDESGHTGANLFDETQPVLYYGLLSSKTHLDYVAESRLATLRRRLDVERLHAAQLGNGRLSQIANDLVNIQKSYRLRFDFFRVAKPDLAIICFFDQVFDPAMNPAITWTGYWTPIRYILLIKLAFLFDKELVQRAWAARIILDNETADGELIAICEELRSRVSLLPDARSRQLIGDALAWAIANPRDLSYNVDDRTQILQITPNLIGFQLVMHGIAQRMRTNDHSASSIIVDRQSQFNKAQQTLAEWYATAAGKHWPMGLSMPDFDFRGMPTAPIEFKAGTESAGLELVDIYLWIFKRLLEKKKIAQELYPLLSYQFNRGRTNEISLAAIEAKWTTWLQSLPQRWEMSEEQLKRGQEILLIDESRRLEAIKGQF